MLLLVSAFLVFTLPDALQRTSHPRLCYSISASPDHDTSDLILRVSNPSYRRVSFSAPFSQLYCVSHRLRANLLRFSSTHLSSIAPPVFSALFRVRSGRVLSIRLGSNPFQVKSSFRLSKQITSNPYLFTWFLAGLRNSRSQLAHALPFLIPSHLLHISAYSFTATPVLFITVPCRSVPSNSTSHLRSASPNHFIS